MIGLTKGEHHDLKREKNDRDQGSHYAGVQRSRF